MNQHLLVKIRQLCVANLGNRLAKAGPMSVAIALGLTCDCRLDLAYFSCAAERLRINQRPPSYMKKVLITNKVITHFFITLSKSIARTSFSRPTAFSRLMRALSFICIALLGLAAQAQGLLGDLRNQGTGFAQVTTGRTLQFPRDHSAHPDYRIEWWYLSANLTDGEDRDWGLQWTLFRQALSPQAVDAGWQNNQIWMAHAAITTPDGHFYEQRFARGGIGQAGVTRIDRDGYFNAWMDDWQWRSNAAALFPAKIEFSIGGREIVLTLETTGELVVNGVDGYSQKSTQGQASYYYSQPYIQVSGFVNQGSEKTYLSGKGWLDREWSSQALADNQQGWDWFSLHLADGYRLMVYQLRHDDGEHWLSGNWIDPNGNSTVLNGDDIELSPLQTREIATGQNQSRQLPMEWQLTLAGQNRRWRIRPLYDQQWMGTRFPYWEGVALVEDEQGTRVGVGYMELTGYQ
jgi:predicted secreted hydrolase